MFFEVKPDIFWYRAFSHKRVKYIFYMAVKPLAV